MVTLRLKYCCQRKMALLCTLRIFQTHCKNFGDYRPLLNVPTYLIIQINLTGGMLIPEQITGPLLFTRYTDKKNY